MLSVSKMPHILTVQGSQSVGGARDNLTCQGRLFDLGPGRNGRSLSRCYTSRFGAVDGDRNEMSYVVYNTDRQRQVRADGAGGPDVSVGANMHVRLSAWWWQ